MNTDDVIKTYEFLGHSPVEVTTITPPQFKGDPNTGVKDCVWIDTLDKFVALCSRWESKANIYVGLNERDKNFKPSRAHRASKKDIVAVYFIPIDIDAVRDEKTDPNIRYQAATNNELTNALEVCEVLWRWFEQRGFLLPAYAMSGNGAQLWARIPRYELANEPKHGTEFEWELRLKAFYDEVRAAVPPKYADKVKIDSIGDVTRIFKVIGTTSVKGAPTKYPDRPHRESYWIVEPTIGQEDVALRDYILSLPISRPVTVSIPKKPQGRGARTTATPTRPQLTQAQKDVLDMAMKAPYVVMARQRINPSDASESDWAFLKELSKEGIYNPDMLTHALMTTKDTKFFRDGKGSYLMRTVENFVNKLPGISTKDARRQLEQEFDKLNINSNNRNMVVCGAGISLGKTYCAKKKTVEVVEQGINVLIVVPSHTLATEWESMELPDKLREIYDKHGVPLIVHLYGITHESVQCTYRAVGMRLLGMGHSKLFKAKYCHGACDRREECLHVQSVKQAKGAPILIAQHEHSHIHQGFFNLKTLSNDRRAVIIIDELAQFVHAARLRRKDLFGNMKLYRTIADEKAGKHSDVFFWDFLADRLEGMLKALENRQGYTIPERFFVISPTDANKLDAEIAQYYMNIERTPKVRNLLWDLCYLLERKPPIQYDTENDCLLYRWRPDFGNRTVLILSGTTRREYVEKQLGYSIDGSIAEGWNVRRENLKVVQLLVGMGGRNRLLKQCDSSTFIKQHGKLFDLMLYKHEGKRMALITSLGEDAPHTKAEESAKGRILRALSPIAERHGRNLVAVSNEMLQKDVIPDGTGEIPIFHFGMKGIDRLNGKFDVVWEVNAHYYHRLAIKQAMYEKFDIEFDIEDEKPQRDAFVSTDPNMKFETHRYIYDPLVELELEHTQVADMEQTIGRFLREEDVYKVIYRTHNVNIRPYPTRVYKSWKALFEYEFSPYVPPEAWLSGKAADVWQWINKHNGEFTTGDVANAVGVPLRIVKQRYLKDLISLDLIDIVKQGGSGQGDIAIYQKCVDISMKV